MHIVYLVFNIHSIDLVSGYFTFSLSYIKKKELNVFLKIPALIHMYTHTFTLPPYNLYYKISYTVVYIL